MADSSTNLDLIPSGVGQPEVPANAMLDAASPVMLYGRRASTCAALTWGYYGGKLTLSDGSLAAISNGTIALSASATNYIEANPATGAVSKNTTGFTAGAIPLYSVVAGSSSVTSYTDKRSVLLAGAAQVPKPYVVGGSWNGKPGANEVVLRHMFVVDVTFPAGLTGSAANAEIAAMAQADFTIYKRASGSDTSKGTMRWAASGTSASFIFASETTFEAGTIIKGVGPASPDATLADIAFSFLGTRI